MIFTIRLTSGGYLLVENDRMIFTSLGFILDENGWVKNEEINFQIDTIEELLAFQKRVEYPIIIDGDTIEIYNNYRE